MPVTPEVAGTTQAGGDAGVPLRVPALADRLETLLRAALERPVLVGEVLDLADEEAFGLLLVVFSLPLMVPGGPGALGVVFTLLGLQRLVGRRHPWIPDRLRRMRVPPKLAGFLLARGVPLLRRLEGSGGRVSPWAASEVAQRLVATLSIALGILLLPPIPGFNTPPALSILLMGAGLVRRSSLLLALGLGLGGVLVVGVTLLLVLGTRWLT